MFRLIRLPILLLIAFTAGMLMERNAQSDRCRDAGGSVKGDLCLGARDE